MEEDFQVIAVEVPEYLEEYAGWEVLQGGQIQLGLVGRLLVSFVPSVEYVGRE